MAAEGVVINTIGIGSVGALSEMKSWDKCGCSENMVVSRLNEGLQDITTNRAEVQLFKRILKRPFNASA
jgi:hypothetical protein